MKIKKKKKVCFKFFKLQLFRKAFYNCLFKLLMERKHKRFVLKKLSIILKKRVLHCLEL